MRRVVLSAATRAAIDAQGFVAVSLGFEASFGAARARSALVGRAGGRLRAYANVCRHQAVQLDLDAASPMSDDGLSLLCHHHGALYRPEDGVCFLGPCRGERLFPIAIDESGGEIALLVP